MHGIPLALAKNTCLADAGLRSAGDEKTSPEICLDRNETAPGSHLGLPIFQRVFQIKSAIGEKGTSDFGQLNPRIGVGQIPQVGFDEFRFLSNERPMPAHVVGHREAWLEGALGGTLQASKDPRFAEKLEAICGPVSGSTKSSLACRGKMI